MKADHKKIIDRAHEIGLHPSELASELLQHDLIKICLKQMHDLPDVWPRLSEAQQNQAIAGVEEAVEKGVNLAIRIIASKGALAVPIKLAEVKVKKNIRLIADVEGDTPHRHAVTDAADKLCLLVLAPDDYDQATDFIKGDADQLEIPIAIEQQTFETPPPPAGDEDPLLEQAKQFVIESGRASVSAVQRQFGIGYNRGAAILERLQGLGVVSPQNETGRRQVIHGLYVPPDAGAGAASSQEATVS
jgi:S-DNA-T family DNA segregation ATPase FtsK/SpoIIIE